MKNPIIVALDVPTAEQALSLVEKLKGVVGGFKIGSELFTSAGPNLVVRVATGGAGLLFLDLKFHDIPNTVAKAVAAATRLFVGMLNVHASGGLEMMSAAKQAAQSTALGMEKPPPLVLGVTMLTSLDHKAVESIGFNNPLGQVERLAKLAIIAGLDGLICSPREVAAVRKIVPAQIQLVTPGIRMPGAEAQDQKRTGTPKQAIQDGANWLVIGRPITEDPDPRAAAEKILASLN